MIQSRTNMLTNSSNNPSPYPVLHLLGQHRFEYSHEGIEHGSNIVVIERFEPPGHRILESHHHRSRRIKFSDTAIHLHFASFFYQRIRILKHILNTCHSLSLASVKSRLGLPFWYRLTWVVLEKGPLNGCVCVCALNA